MKRVLLSAAILFACGMASAQKLTYVPYNTATNQNAFLMGTAVSANGRYVAGGDNEKAFICDMQTGEIKYFKSEFLGETDVTNVLSTVNSVTNDGVGYGYLENQAAKFDFATGVTTKISTDYATASSTNSDGSMQCGFTYDDSYKTSPVYWDSEGNMKSLPQPTDSWAGFGVNGASARQISEDGNVIIGHIVDDFGTYPAIVWHKNSDDSYSADLICKPYFNGSYDAWQKYDNFSVEAISANGKWAAILMHDYDENYDDNGMYMARYDIEADTLQILNCPNHSAELYYYPNGISNDGTIVGYTEDGMDGSSRVGIIVKGGEDTAKNISEVYPSIADFKKMDGYLNDSPCAITPDGRYIVGFGYVDSPLSESDLWTATWLLDTGVSTEVENAAADNLSKKVVASYNLEGKKLNGKSATRNSVVINRLANGKSVKNIVK